MPRVLLAQITDCHVVESGELLSDRVDTAQLLREAVAHINAFTPAVDLVLATGDLVNDGRPAQYEVLLEILAELRAPVLPIPGNHDDRTAMRAAFGDALPSGGPDDLVSYVVEDHPLRLVALDTTVPGEHGGHIERTQMAWLDQTLSEAPTRPTVVFQHHPPFTTGIRWMDDVGLAGSQLEEDVLRRHRQVEAVLCGHIHRSIHTRFAGTVASTWPSTGAQVALALDGTPYGYIDETPAVAMHQWSEDHGVRSHVSHVTTAARWVPPWAEEATEASGD